METKCLKANFEGTIQNQSPEGATQVTAKEATITGLYTECSTTLGKATVKMNGCKYTITSTATALTANVDITGCTTGKAIEVESAGCLITVPEQGPLSHITFANKGSGENQDVEANITIQGIQYTIEPVSGCIISKQQHSDAQYKGTATFKGYKDEGTGAQVEHEKHIYNPLICGAQRGLFAT